MYGAVQTFLAQRQTMNTDFNLAANDMTPEPFDHAGMIVLHMENVNRLYFVFWKLH